MTRTIDVRILANLAPTDWVTLSLTAGATVVGALIGALIAYIVARQTARDNEAAILRAERRADEAATHRASVKLMQLLNSAGGYHHQTEAGLKIAAASMPGETRLGLLMRAGSGPGEIEFDVSDIMAFIKAKHFDYVTELIFLADSYNNMVRATASYGVERAKMLAMFSPASMDGLVGTMVGTEADERRLMPYITSVSDQAEQLRALMKEVFDAAQTALPKFAPIVRKYFNDPRFPAPGAVPAVPPGAGVAQAAG